MLQLLSHAFNATHSSQQMSYITKFQQDEITASFQEFSRDPFLVLALICAFTCIKALAVLTSMPRFLHL